MGERCKNEEAKTFLTLLVKEGKSFKEVYGRTTEGTG